MGVLYDLMLHEVMPGLDCVGDSIDVSRRRTK